MSLTLKFYAGNYGIYHECAENKNDIFFPNSLRDTRSFVELLFYLLEKLDQNFSRISAEFHWLIILGTLFWEIYDLNNNGYYYLSLSARVT